LLTKSSVYATAMSLCTLNLKITDIFLKNGYPLWFIQKQIREFLNRKYSIKFTPTQNNNVRRILFKLPYIGYMSINFEKLKTFLQQTLADKVLLTVIHDPF